MEITAQMVKDLRQKTGYGFKVCRDALEESNGNFEKAKEILRLKGEGKASEMASRPTNEGTIGSYIHFNKLIGVLVEIATQTDSLAQSQEVQEFASSVAMQVAFSNPQFISRDKVPVEIVENEKRIALEELKDSGKPEFVIEKIVNGRLEKLFEEKCLLDQKFIKDESILIGQWMSKIAAQGKENVQIRRITRFEVGK